MLNEIENGTEDYQKTNPDHLVLIEVKKVTNDATSRIVIPAYGTFFSNSLKVRDITSKLPLTRGRDYKLGTLDERATKLSGKECPVCFVITNNDILGIEYDYHYVGGVHSNGKYLIDLIKAQYPNGIEATKHWDNIKNKPTQFKPKPHIHSIRDTYGYDDINRQLDRMVVGINTGTDVSLANIYVRADSRISELELTTTQEIADIRTELQTTFEMLRVQQGEYIFTDSLENPSIKRGYGTWQRVVNTVLRGAQNDLIVGDGAILSLGSKQALRNTYIWINKDAGVQPGVSLFTDNSLIVGNVIQIPEGQTFEIGVSTSGLAAGTELDWIIEGIDDQYIDEAVSKRFGKFVLDALGQARQNIRFKDNPAYIGDRTCTFMLEHLYGVKYNIRVLDTIRAKWCEMKFTHDPAGTIPAVRVNEGSMIYLQLKFHGYNVGETIYLDWSASTIPDYDYEIKPLSFISATASTLTLALKVKENHLTDGERVLVVYAKSAPEDVLSNEHTMAYALVSDVSTGINVQIDFKKNNQIITNVGEGESFDVTVKTNLSVGSKVELLYESSKALNEFTGLQPYVIVDAAGYATFNVSTKIDFLTNEGVQLLKLTALVDDKNVAENTLIIRDTSQTPNYDMSITKPNSTVSITKINEGEDFWVRIKVSGWTTTTTPPTLVFNYGLDGNYGQNSGVALRVNSSFHSQLEFSSASATYDDVDWTNGELILKMTAIADHQFSGSKPFNIAIKQSNMDQFLLQSSVMIMDTSVLDVVTAWSSSAVILNPITQVNEMQSDGTNNTMYLWLDVEGDGSLFNDITIQATGQITADDFITVFPNVVQFETGKSRRIFAITLAADFLNEGNENLTVYGTYIDANGATKEIFRTSVLIVDNSIQIPLDVKLSLSNSDPDQLPAGNKWSEYSTAYAHVSFPAYALATNVVWQITQNPTGDATAQFQSVGGSVPVGLGVPKVVIPIQPTADRLQDGEFAALLSCQRQLQVNNKTIGSGSRGFTLLDDSLPMTVDTKFYSSAARTTEKYIFNEGDTVYGRTTLTNPFSKFYLMHNNINVNDVVMGGNVYLGASSDVFSHPEQRKVKAVYDVVASNVSYTQDFQFTLLRNRRIETRPQIIDIGAVVVQNNSPTYQVGDTSNITYGASMYAAAIKSITVNDTSKTAIYNMSASMTSGGAAVTDVDEGEYFYVTLKIQDGEAGDVYTISKSNSDSVFPLGRFDFHQFGLDQVQSLANDQITWRFRVRLDRNTNPEDVITFVVINKNTGLAVGTLQVTINDIYKTPALQITYILLYNGTYYTPDPISENTPSGGQQYLVITGDEYLLTDETIKIARLSGRPTSKWEPATNWDREFPVVALTNEPLCPPGLRNRNGAIIPIKPSHDMYTNPAGELTISFRASTSITSATKDASYGIKDASQTRSFLEVGWVDSNGNPISSVNEGESATLRVRVSGGEDDIDVKVENNGGRSVGRLTNHEYGVTKSRSTDGKLLEWVFRPTLDYTGNTGAETKLAVRVTVPDTSGLIRDIELPINDLSKAVTGSVTYHGYNSTNVISFVREGEGFGPVFDLSKPNLNDQFRMIVKSNRSGSEWAVDTTLYGYQFINMGNDQYRYKFQREVAEDTTTNSPAQLYLTSELWDVSRNVLLASGQLTIIDTSRERVDSSNIRITNPLDGSHTHLNSVNEGSTVRLYFAPQCFVNTNWNQRAFAWEASTGDFTPQTGYMWQHSLAPDGSFSVDVSIPADETTNGNRNILVNLYEVYDDVGGPWSYRGQSASTTIIDTSPLPYIVGAFFSTEPDQSGYLPASIVGPGINGNPGVTVSEGDIIYLQVWAVGLTSDGSSTSVNVSWGGTATIADFDVVLPTTITMVPWTAEPYFERPFFKGISGPIVIKNDQIEG